MAVTSIDNEDNFKKEVLEAEGLVVVDFWATWCGPCKMFGPVYEAVSEDDAYKTVKFIKVDTEELESVAAENKIFSIPTLVVYKDGERVADKAGAMNKDQLKEFLDAHK